MSWLNVLIVRLRALFRRDQVLHEIDEELRAHIEMEAEANLEMGMTPEQARIGAVGEGIERYGAYPWDPGRVLRAAAKHLDGPYISPKDLVTYTD